MVRSAVPVEGSPGYSALMQCRVRSAWKSVETWSVVDGSAANQVRSLIARATVGVHDDRTFAGEIFQQAGADGLHDLADGGGIVVGRHTDENVRLADVNQLAKKLIGKNAFLGQIFASLLAVVRFRFRISVLRYFASNLAQTEPVELVRTQG